MADHDASSIEARRAANRAAAPNVAAVIDEFQAVFGKVQVIWAIDQQTGKVFGNPPKEKLDEQRQD